LSDCTVLSECLWECNHASVLYASAISEIQDHILIPNLIPIVPQKVKLRLSEITERTNQEDQVLEPRLKIKMITHLGLRTSCNRLVEMSTARYCRVGAGPTTMYYRVLPRTTAVTENLFSLGIS
jgi:hypothetical protein